MRNRSNLSFPSKQAVIVHPGVSRLPRRPIIQRIPIRVRQHPLRKPRLNTLPASPKSLPLNKAGLTRTHQGLVSNPASIVNPSTPSRAHTRRIKTRARPPAASVGPPTPPTPPTSTVRHRVRLPCLLPRSRNKRPYQLRSLISALCRALSTLRLQRPVETRSHLRTLHSHLKVM